MKSLLALFAVTAVLGVAAIAAPASAAEARIKMKCDWTQNLDDQKDCVCVAEVRENKLIDGRRIWMTTWRPAICPANGGGGGSASSDDPGKPDKPHKHGKSVSKGESSSSVVSVGTVLWGTPIAVTAQHQENSAFSTGNGGAGADAGSGGGALAVNGGYFSGGAGWGSTGGGSCAGTGCNQSPAP
jgi:hypothetical protein